MGEEVNKTLNKKDRPTKSKGRGQEEEGETKRKTLSIRGGGRLHMGLN